MSKTIMRYCFIALTCFIPPKMQAAVSPVPVQQVTTFDTFELPEWFKISFLDLSEDNLEAVESNKHLVVFFWQDFCGYCKEYHREKPYPTIIREMFDEHFDVVALNIWGSRGLWIRW